MAMDTKSVFPFGFSRKKPFEWQEKMPTPCKQEPSLLAMQRAISILAMALCAATPEVLERICYCAQGSLSVASRAF
jgi:hypothetical protein